MTSVGRYFQSVDFRSIELSKNNAFCKRQEAIEVVHKAGLRFSTDVHLCQTRMKTNSRVPVGKYIRFWSTSPKFNSVLTRRLGSCEVVLNMLDSLK